MKRKSKTVPNKPSKTAAREAKKKTVRQVRGRPITAGTAAVNQGEFVAMLGELVEISGDMRTLLVEIRDLLAEGAKQDQAREEREAGVEAVIVAEAEPEEDVE